MDNKKKIVIVIGMIIGAAFLWIGLDGMKQKAAEDEAKIVEAVGTVDETSADALGNI